MAANKCFFTGPNQLKSSQDYTNQKKAQTLYKTLATNTKNNKEDNIQAFIQPEPDRCLASVGGYNVSNYDLLLNLTKGKYYNTINQKVSSNAQIISTNNTYVNACQSVTITANNTLLPVDQTYDMYEGPFLIHDPAIIYKQDAPDASNACHNCFMPTLDRELILDICKNILSTFPFAKLVTEEKLRNFDFPIKFRINNPK